MARDLVMPGGRAALINARIQGARGSDSGLDSRALRHMYGR
jgi:hypothetical protein